MRIVTLLLLSLCLLFSVSLTPEQLQLAKAAGYSESQIQSQLEKASSDKEEEKITTQEVKNDIVKSENLFTKKLQRYGALFFNNKNTLNPYSVPTPSNYNLTFGDKISLIVYGSTNQEFNLSIDNNGNVTIPQVGELELIGLTFNDAKDLIKEETKKAFPNSTNILVDMLEYASIQVTISGFVNAPGLYNLSSFSTVKDALMACGGILENGSYRNIYLKRDGEVKKVFDLYQLVRYGDISSDEMLENGDVILVKPIDKEVILTGDVNYEAIFELKKGETFNDLINYAAGFKPRANQNAIKLKRYESDTLKVYTLNKNELFKMTPKSGDEVHIYPTSILGAKLVMIDGNIVAPGEREIPSDKKLSTLLKGELKQFGLKGYFKNDTNYDYATVINDNDIKSFNLQKVLDGKLDLTLEAGDNIVIYKNDELQERPYVFVSGMVVDDDKQKYDFYDGMKAKDLFSVVKFKSDTTLNDGRKQIQVDKSKIQVSRIEENEKRVYLVTKEELATFNLKKFDNIKFFEYSEVNNIQSVTIKGEVFIPGTYDLTTGTKLKDIINLAGGLTKKVLFSKFEIVRYEVKYDERERIIMSLDLKNALDQNIEIKPDDEITIFPIANWNDKLYVDIKGMVRFPGKYPVSEGEKLSSLIQRAGGFLDTAFLEGSVFTREEIRELQVKRLEESIERIKARVTQANLSATGAGEKVAEQQNMLNTVKMIEKESNLNKPIGRISLELFNDLESFKNSKYDITLKDKDALYIPSINDTVSVVGEVLNQTTFVYDKDLNAYNYIEKAGGLNDTADSEMVYVVKANGEAIKLSSGYFWNDSSKVYKGDTIVVPMKFETVSDITFVKDVTSIVYQLAITAASLKTVGGL